MYRLCSPTYQSGLADHGLSAGFARSTMNHPTAFPIISSDIQWSISAPLQQWRSTHPQCARAEASSTNLIIILGMMQVSKRVPFDDPFVLNVVRAVYLASSALPHPEEFISVMHEGCATWDLHKLHQVTSTKRPGVDMGESTGQR
ncbi:hypothetical protein H9Q71_007059 [Fusarium xylarioides]|nr:hypothetical protein H9Q71_007059 [Fusarium xylarioides]